jgi:GMP synthase (glutamine-hydrolysing)
MSWQDLRHIKSHHTWRPPERMDLELVEPVRDYSGSRCASWDGIWVSRSRLGRHPFPDPARGAHSRTGDPEALATLREADRIFLEELRLAGLYDAVWQAFAVLLPVRTVGVMGDERTYANVIALRAVTSTDGMTADWFPLPAEVLGRAASRIVNALPGVNRIVYDVTSKPPATIEWE